MHPSASLQQRLLLTITLALMAAAFVPSVVRSFGDGTSWSVSDLHIRYAAGFIRRGLLGEAAFRLHEASALSTALFFPALFAVLTAVQIGLLAVLAWPLRARPALFLLVMLAPALVLFPAYDYGGYLRKEAFITIGLFAHAICVRRVLRGTMTERAYRHFAYFALGPYLALAMLIHENQAILLPVHALLLYMASGYPKAGPHIARLQVPVMLPATLCFLAAVIRHGDGPSAATICSSWDGRAVTACDAINFLAWGYDQVWVYLVQLVTDPRALWIYIATIVLALAPPILVRRALPAEGQAPLGLFLAASFPMAVLFLLGWDWGRWIHIASVGLISPILAGAVRAPAPANARPLVALAAMAAALLYVSTWRVNVCCLPTSLSGGLTRTLVADIPTLFLPEDVRERAVSVK
jgi:hypothetical protein